jgi:hypothetical protein
MSAPAGIESKLQIWKYPIDCDKLTNDGLLLLELPLGAEILTIQLQHKSPTLWAKVDTSLPLEVRRIHVYGTGHTIQRVPLTYLGTVQMYSGGLVLHFFEEIGTGGFGGIPGNPFKVRGPGNGV